MNQLALDSMQRAPSLAEQIYRRLRQLLCTGAFAAGERLIDANLAQTLSVSRTPVREALNRLAADGLIETRSGGFQVITPTEQDMREIFDMRRLLEPPAARAAADAITPGMAKELSQALSAARRAEKAEDFTAFAEANYAFRAIWLDAVPNTRLRETVLRFDNQAGLVRRSTLVLPQARKEALALLEKLATAFKDRDGRAASTLSLAFVNAAARFFQETIEEDR